MSLLRHITKLRTAVFTTGILLVSGAPSQAHANPLSLFGDAAAGIADFAIKPIVLFILTFSGWILGLAGVFFNWVVIKTVFQFGVYFGTSDGMLIAWGVLRDISNIALLFGFIFMGILLILNVDSGGHGHGGGMSAKKAIPRLIIFAVLLNFSLFASQAVIDVANAFASQFAALAGTSCDEIRSSGECANVGISGQVMQMAGIGSIWSDGIMQGLKTDSIVLLGLSLFVIITAMVLIAAGIMLVVRVVILSLLMVTSPIGFAGMVIPGLQGVASKWWHMLISQSFFAPVMLLLMFISLKLAESLNPEGQPLVKAFTGEASGVASNMQVVVVFAIVIGFMIASLAAASKMGAMGASFATKTAGAVALGGVGFVGRRTVGRASNWTGERIRKSSIGKTELGRGLAGVADYGAKSSYSLRTTSNKALGATKIGVDVGKANKTAEHGYHGIEEKAIKERTEYAKTLIGRDETPEEKAAREAVAENTKKAATDLGISENLKKSAESQRDVVKSRVDSQERVLETLKQSAEEQKKSSGAVDAQLAKDVQAAEQEFQKRSRLLREAQDTLDLADQKVTETKVRLETAQAEEGKTVLEIKNATSKKGAQQQYKEDLEKRGHRGWVPLGKNGRTFAVSQRANHHAAQKIKSDILEKTDLDKALEKAAKKKAEEDKTGENHDAPKEKSQAGDGKKADDHAH